MNKTIKALFSGMVFFLLCLNIQAKEPAKIIVQIEFNGANFNVEKAINYQNDLTALEALQMVAIVATHPVGEYVFVDEINGVKNIKELNAWYFTVNDVPSKTLAINRQLEAGDVVKWIYKTDVCSKTVKNKSGEKNSCTK